MLEGRDSTLRSNRFLSESLLKEGLSQTVTTNWTDLADSADGSLGRHPGSLRWIASWPGDRIGKKGRYPLGVWGCNHMTVKELLFQGPETLP